MYKILVLNLGSTSSKIAVYEDGEVKKETTIEHTGEDLKDYRTVIEQKDYRKNKIKEWLDQEEETLASFDAIAPRGGLLHPVLSGTYQVNADMVDDLISCRYGSHASNLAGIIAYELAIPVGIPALTTDPVVVDEFIPEARFSGSRLLTRTSVFHALNQKAAARKAAQMLGKKYEMCNLIVAHLGGGITIGAHCMGKVIDANNGADGDGPFSANRTGSLPVGDLIRLCFSGKYSQEEMLQIVNGRGGLLSYLGENDMRKIEQQISEGDETARKVRNALVYQIAKAIGEYSVVSREKIDAIVLTGGMAYSRDLTEQLREYIKEIAPILIFPGECEQEALEQGARRVLMGQETAKLYQKIS